MAKPRQACARTSIPIGQLCVQIPHCTQRIASGTTCACDSKCCREANAAVANLAGAGGSETAACEVDSADRLAGGEMTNCRPQRGHFPRLPASSAAAFRTLPHWQVNSNKQCLPPSRGGSRLSSEQGQHSHGEPKLAQEQVIPVESGFLSRADGSILSLAHDSFVGR